MIDYKISKHNFFELSFMEKMLIIQFLSMEKMFIIQFQKTEKMLILLFSYIYFCSMKLYERV